MTGILVVSDNGTPQVITDIGVFNLLGCKLVRHTMGYWNFNMALDGKYTAYGEGDEVSGVVLSNKTFFAFSIVTRKF